MARTRYSMFFANPDNNAAFGEIALANHGDQPVAVTRIEGEVTLSAKGEDNVYLLSFKLERMRLNPLEECRILAYAHINDIPIPGVWIYPTKRTAKVRHGEPIIVLDSSAAGPKDCRHVFPDKKLVANLRVTIRSTGGDVPLIDEPIEIYEMSSAFCTDNFGHQCPFDGVEKLPKEIWRFMDGAFIYWRDGRPLEERPASR